MKFAATATAATILAMTASATAHAGCTLKKFLELPVSVKASQPLAAVKINGGDATMLLDTGAFFSFLSPDAARQFGLPLRHAPFGLRVVGVGGAETPDETTVQDFGIGPATLHRIDFLVAGNRVAGESFSGILGQNFLRLGDIEFDLANGVARLMRPEHCDKTNLAYWAQNGQSYGVLDIQDTSLQQPAILATANINGVDIRVMIDSGSGTSGLTLRAAARAGLTPQDPGAVPGGVMIGLGRKNVETWIVPVKDFKLDQLEIKNTHLRIEDLDELAGQADMLLGTDFLLSHRVYISYQQRKMFFTYNGGPVFDLSVHRLAPGAAPGQAAADSSAPGGSEPGSDAPVDAGDFDRRGTAFASRGELDKAIPDFARAIEMDPGNPQYPYDRAQALLRNRQPVLAMSDLDQAIRLKPDLVPALLTRAELRLSAHDTAGARADFDTAAAHAPDDVALPLREARDYLNSEDYPAAIDLYDHWIAAHAHDERLPNALAGRCLARGFLGLQLDAALADCNAALKQDSSASPSFANRAVIHLRRGEYDQAISDADAALKLQPKNAEALYSRGLARLRKDQKPLADADMQAALVLAPAIAKRFERIGLGAQADK